MKKTILLGIFAIMLIGLVSAQCSVCNETCSPCGGGCNATDLTVMYYGVTDFNTTYGDITGWNTSCITSIEAMFRESDFNQDISGWDVSNVNNFRWMFFDNTVFNQPIGSWNTSSATDISFMFYNAEAFNQPIGGWDTSHVTTMTTVLNSMNSFDQNVGTWNVTANGNFEDFFTNTHLSVANYDAVLLGWSTQPVASGMEFNANPNQYSPAGKVGRDILTDTYGWSITDGGLAPCTPDWTCNGYGACLFNNTKECNSVTDLNICGDTYLGDYSEFPPQLCIYQNNTYVPSHTSTDIAGVVIDFFVEYGIQMVMFVGLIALIMLAIYILNVI